MRLDAIISSALDSRQFNLELFEFLVSLGDFEFDRVDDHFVDQILLENHSVVLIREQFPEKTPDTLHDGAHDSGRTLYLKIIRAGPMPHPQELDEFGKILILAAAIAQRQCRHFRHMKARRRVFGALPRGGRYIGAQAGRNIYICHKKLHRMDAAYDHPRLVSSRISNGLQTIPSSLTVALLSQLAALNQFLQVSLDGIAVVLGKALDVADGDPSLFAGCYKDVL